MKDLIFGKVKHIKGKGENAANQHFLLLSPCFQKVFALGCNVKLGNV